MTAAILERHGLRTGTYLSPHLVSLHRACPRRRRRRRPRARSPPPSQRAAHAAAKVDRTLEEDDRVTQFEALTAAAYCSSRRAGVDVAVVEAGLGGPLRRDERHPLARSRC